MKRSLGLCLLACAAVVHAQDASDTARLGENALRSSSGRIATNQAAGEGNAQANIAVFAVSGTGFAQAQAALRQQARASGGARSRSAQVWMGADALGGSHGLVSINQAAGGGNTQTNLFILESGPVAATVDDGTLARNASAQTPEWTGEASTFRREARIDGGALAGSTGVVQVNQSAGVGNSIANVIALRLSGPGGSQ